MTRAVSSPDPNARMPRQIPFIIASEGCERFSFYGMRNILTPFLITSLLLFLPAEARNRISRRTPGSFPTMPTKPRIQRQLLPNRSQKGKSFILSG